jgi:putative hydrolase of the HAD superfamily
VIEAVVFDWGGTLSVWAEVAEMSDMWRLAARHLAPEREEELCARLVAVEQASWDRIAVDQRSTTLSQLLADASEAVGLDVAEAVLEEAALHHLDSWTPHIRHEPDAAPTLSALRERGLRTGLLSNTHWPRSFHERFLERDGLVDLLDVRCYTSEMPRTKPHADAFGHVLGLLGIDDPSRAVFVGDRLVDDVAGSKAAGMLGVFRHNDVTPTCDVEPDGVIKSLSELVAIIDGWNA